MKARNTADRYRLHERYPNDTELKRRAKRLVGLDEATTDRAQLEIAADRARKEGKNAIAKMLLK
jgi:hypothetical protein